MKVLFLCLTKKRKTAQEDQKYIYTIYLCTESNDNAFHLNETSNAISICSLFIFPFKSTTSMQVYIISAQLYMPHSQKKEAERYKY